MCGPVKTTDRLFAELSVAVLDTQARSIAAGSVEYIVAQHPDCLRRSVANARTQIRATYFIDRLRDAEHLLGRIMRSWLEFNSTLVVGNKLNSFTRLLVIRDSPDRVEKYWEHIDKICQQQGRAGIQIRVLIGGAFFD